MRFYDVSAVIIRVRDFMEADRMVTLLSRERGKIRAVARGARRPRNRLSGSTQLFCYGSYSLVSGKGLDNLSQGDISESFISLREDLDKMTYAAYLAEVMDEMVEEGDRQEELFALLLNAFLLLERGDAPDLVTAWFTIRLLYLLGYRPELGHCGNCRQDNFAAGMWLSPAQGSLLCPDCYRLDPQAIRITPGLREVLKHLLTVEASRLRVLKLAPERLTELNRVLEAMLTQHLPRPLKSLEFLQMVKLTPDEDGKKGERIGH